MSHNNVILKMYHYYLICLLSSNLKALWMMETRDITDDMHEEFYRFLVNAYDRPRYHLHYKADAPINIRALFYVPEYKPSKHVI